MGFATFLRRKHFRDAGGWLLWAVIGGLAPILLSAFLLAFLGARESIPSLFEEGQLALYAASAAGTALYLTSIDRDPPGMKLRGSLNFTAYGVSLLAITMYVAVQTVDAIGTRFPELGSLHVDTGVAVVTSIVCYVVGISAAFLATLIDNERLDKKFADVQGGHLDDLRDDLRKMKR